MSKPSRDPVMKAELHPSELPDVIDAIGTPRLATQLLSFLHHKCRADHCAVFRLGHDELMELAAASWDGSDTAHKQTALYVNGQHWRRDPAMVRAQGLIETEHAGIIRVDVKQLPDHGLRELVYRRKQVRERLLICGRRAEDGYCLSIVRTDEQETFSAAELAELSALADTLVAIISKHASIAGSSAPLLPLASVALIESCIASSPEPLPRREAEVCARFLYGMSSAGISVDLGIGAETVTTYRKRAYQRLGLSTRRELLVWYLTLWSSFDSHAGAKRSARADLTPV
ncbi:helix-turn-helix transcriptional regulator [Nevskia sp.]|uniref:helix-turn-helix transcriptional regulator n=1 Tax=Nevskia sp. TaxID=1929292 RepID=UPI0025ED2049|nr:helix-turn-helix transcriptional regulator [Nevskia sp.]